MLGKCIACGCTCDLGQMHCHRCIAASKGSITALEIQRTLRKLEEWANGKRR